MAKAFVAIESEETDCGFAPYLHQVVTFFCANYIYSGRLVRVEEDTLFLEDAGIIYETGPFTDPEWKDRQPIPQGKWQVQVAAIESWGVMK